MDFRPHPEKAHKTIVTTHNPVEHHWVSTNPFLPGGIRLLAEQASLTRDPKQYPAEVTVRTARLSRTAGNLGHAALRQLEGTMFTPPADPWDSYVISQLEARDQINGYLRSIVDPIVQNAENAY